MPLLILLLTPLYYQLRPLLGKQQPNPTNYRHHCSSLSRMPTNDSGRRKMRRPRTEMRKFITHRFPSKFSLSASLRPRGTGQMGRRGTDHFARLSQTEYTVPNQDIFFKFPMGNSGKTVIAHTQNAPRKTLMARMIGIGWQAAKEGWNHIPCLEWKSERIESYLSIFSHCFQNTFPLSSHNSLFSIHCANGVDDVNSMLSACEG